MIIYLYIVKCGRLCMGSPVLRMEVFFMGMQLSKDEAGKMLAELKKVNTIARIVNPVTERVLDSGLFTETDTICHNVWGKCERCENCSSLRAYRDHASAYKMEICKGQVYWIISRYVFCQQHFPKNCRIIPQKQQGISLKSAGRYCRVVIAVCFINACSIL